jgi:hypothetical protein
MSTYQLKTMITQILEILVSIENESADEYKLWCNSEYDSNLTEFERLSNNGLIKLKTKLNELDTKVAIRLLSYIVQENYYIFEMDVLIDYLDDSIDEQMHQYEKDKCKLSKYNCPNLWLKYLRIVCDDNVITDLDDEFVDSDVFQKTELDLKDINVNLRMTRTCLVNIVT